MAYPDDRPSVLSGAAPRRLISCSGCSAQFSRGELKGIWVDQINSPEISVVLHADRFDNRNNADRLRKLCTRYDELRRRL